MEFVSKSRLAPGLFRILRIMASCLDYVFTPYTTWDFEYEKMVVLDLKDELETKEKKLAERERILHEKEIELKGLEDERKNGHTAENIEGQKFRDLLRDQQEKIDALEIALDEARMTINTVQEREKRFEVTEAFLRTALVSAEKKLEDSEASLRDLEVSFRAEVRDREEKLRHSEQRLRDNEKILCEKEQEVVETKKEEKLRDSENVEKTPIYDPNSDNEIPSKKRKRETKEQDDGSIEKTIMIDLTDLEESIPKSSSAPTSTPKATQILRPRKIRKTLRQKNAKKVVDEDFEDIDEKELRPRKIRKSLRRKKAKKVVEKSPADEDFEEFDEYD